MSAESHLFTSHTLTERVFLNIGVMASHRACRHMAEEDDGRFLGLAPTTTVGVLRHQLWLGQHAMWLTNTALSEGNGLTGKISHGPIRLTPSIQPLTFTTRNCYHLRKGHCTNMLPSIRCALMPSGVCLRAQQTCMATNTSLGHKDNLLYWLVELYQCRRGVETHMTKCKKVWLVDHCIMMNSTLYNVFYAFNPQAGLSYLNQLDENVINMEMSRRWTQIQIHTHKYILHRGLPETEHLLFDCRGLAGKWLVDVRMRVYFLTAVQYMKWEFHHSFDAGE